MNEESCTKLSLSGDDWRQHFGCTKRIRKVKCAVTADGFIVSVFEHKDAPRDVGRDNFYLVV